ncbi:MAG: hypothetical protein HYS08_09910 [Chlamydiae bacterium]|nr:hypothetical protein [Chlamydiota bacterium]MBI3267036.1 hypothetical protein [Chlamydiota bacterium]
MIELLAAMSVFIIMAFALYVVFDRVNLVWKHGEYKADQYQNARNVLDMMARELTSAVIAVGGPNAFSNNVYGPAYLWSVDGQGGSDYDQDQIFFIFARDNALREVGYYINDQTTGVGNTTAADDVLMRAYTSDTNTDFDITSTGTSFGSYDDTGFKITDLNFNFIYQNGGNYTRTDVWDSRMDYTSASSTSTTVDDGKLPDFIEISIRVVDQEILEKDGISPPQKDRKEFKIMVPMNQRSFRNE